MQGGKTMRNILIYRDSFLPYSETFILAQGESLETYSPYYVGTSCAGALESEVPNRKAIILDRLVSQPGFWKTLYKLSGFVLPRWKKQIYQTQPLLIHAHGGKDGDFALPLSRLLNIPLIVTFHGHDATIEKQPADFKPLVPHMMDFISHRGSFYVDRYLERRTRLFHVPDKFIAVSDFIRKTVIDKGCPSERILTHYIGIDTERFTPVQGVDREPIVLFVGRLVEKKGVEYLIRAMSDVQILIPEAQLVLIGDGAKSSPLKKMADRLNINAKFLGRQTPENVIRWMNKSAVFCGPSVVAKSGDAEGLGMVFLEAQALELPVVSFKSGGIPEAVADEETGILLPEGDTQALGKAITELLQNPELRARFGKAGRHRVLKKFDLKKQTAKLENIYDKLISKGD